MSLSVEELLKPRYKVIADFPWSIYKIGDIINSDILAIGARYRNGLNNFPAIFKKLEWYEDREYKELPQFIRHSPTPDDIHFFKVENWYSNPNTSQIAGVYVENGHRLFIIDCQPATEKDFINQSNA